MAGIAGNGKQRKRKKPNQQPIEADKKPVKRKPAKRKPAKRKPAKRKMPKIDKRKV